MRERRQVQIDSLRALAILFVLYDHFHSSTDDSFAPGAVSVRLFLIMSGYFITRILISERESLSLIDSPFSIMEWFYFRRALRIWPAYLILLAIIYISRCTSMLNLLWHLTFLSNILFAINNQWGPPWMLAHLWTLSVQEQFYLVWPIIILFTPKHAFTFVIILAASSVVFRVIMYTKGLQEHVAAYSLPFASLDALGLGSFIGVMEFRQIVVKIPSRVILTSVLVTAIFCLLFSRYAESSILRDVLLPSFWLFPLGAMLIGAINGYEGILKIILENVALRYIGKISFGIYLYHLPLWAIVIDASSRLGFGRYFAPGWMAFLVMVPLTFLISALSWRYVENPIYSVKELFPRPSRETHKDIHASPHL